MEEVTPNPIDSLFMVDEDDTMQIKDSRRSRHIVTPQNEFPSSALSCTCNVILTIWMLLEFACLGL